MPQTCVTHFIFYILEELLIPNPYSTFYGATVISYINFSRSTVRQCKKMYVKLWNDCDVSRKENVKK